MRNPARTFLEWYRSPEQFLLRIEMAWFRRWLFRGWGLVFLLVSILMGYGSLFGGTSAGGSAYSAFLATSPFGISCGSIFGFVWAWLVKSRSFHWLSGTRLRDLLLTPRQASDFWPALLVAPALFPAAASACMLAGSLLAMASNGRLAAAPVELVVMAALWPPALAVIFLHALAVTAFTVRRAIPRGGMLRVALWGWIASWFFGVTTFVLGSAAIGIFGALFALAPRTPDGVWELIDRAPALAAVVYAGIFLFICSYALLKNIKSLRSERTMDFLRDSLEAEAPDALAARDARDSHA